MTSDSPLLSGLNAQQREAVLATEGPVLVLAGAGSGKTRVITHRIAHLVLDKGIPSERILAVTFTNKAAGEMKARTEALLAGQPLHAWISTFHSLCVRLLRREAAAADLDRGFVIYDEDDQLAAVREALRTLGLSEKLHPPRRLLSRISARKNSGRDPESVEGDSLAAEILADVAGKYRQILESARALDFDDLLLRTVDLLAGREDVRERYRKRFLYLLVDEYQDTNRAQYELVRHLAGRQGNVTVVGDEDQSIYSWRGATIRNILDFEEDFPGARILRLEENYRSSQAILDTASGLVAHNRQRKGKVLRAVRAEGDPVGLYQAADEFQEASFVVERIATIRRKGRVAVLFRMNAQSRLFEEDLRRHGIPYEVIGGVGFYERKEVKDVLAYLRLIGNLRDAVAFRRILNVPPRGIGGRTLDEIDRVSGERRLSAWEALEAIVDEDLLPARATVPLRSFKEMIDQLRGELATTASPRQALERILATSGYSAALAEEDTRESQDRLDNLAELLSAAAEYEAREDSPTVAGFLDRVSLLSDVDQAKGEVPVVLMTLHSAKGLEFEAVFLVGLEEGLIPHSRALTDAEAIEEERRLCYVGMTRAMERLWLTWAQSRLVFGKRRVTAPSRFLTEVPRDRMEIVGAGGVVKRQRPPQLRFGSQSPSDRRPAIPAASPSDNEEIRPGIRVRHPLFGEGTVLRKEGSGEDMKVTVAFAGIGAKRLVARYAGLEVV